MESEILELCQNIQYQNLNIGIHKLKINKHFININLSKIINNDELYYIEFDIIGFNKIKKISYHCYDDGVWFISSD